jgi:hypothetical protein
VNLTFRVGALLVATDPAYVTSTGIGGDALALLMFDLHRCGYILGVVFFVRWLLPMGSSPIAPACPHHPQGAARHRLLRMARRPVIVFALPDTRARPPRRVRPTSIAEFGMIVYLLLRGVRIRPEAPGRARALRSCS